MKLACVVILAALAACSAHRPEVAACAHPGSAYAPPAFGSRANAEQYVRLLHAGGRVTLLHAGGGPVLVVYVYGASVPDVAIAAYRAAEGRWWRMREWGGVLPELHQAELHEAVVEGGAVLVVGARSKNRCLLVAPEAHAG